MSGEEAASKSQRAHEFRRIFDPDHNSTIQRNNAYSSLISQDDGLLSAIAEALLWRLDTSKAFISLISDDTQYFLAGASRENGFVITDGLWFGCSEVSLSGSLCERTLDGARHLRESGRVPVFVVEDMSTDPRFRDRPIAGGSDGNLVFYAGAPITTENGIDIGTLFVMDTKPRINGLSAEHTNRLHVAAQRAMRQLEMWRTADERSRLVSMNQGLAQLLRARTISGDKEKLIDLQRPDSGASNLSGSSFEANPDRDNLAAHSQDMRLLRLATETLKETLGLQTGGINFYDCSEKVSRTQSGVDQSPSLSTHTADLADVMAHLSVPDTQPANRAPDSKFLSSLLAKYPSGTIWYFDDNGHYTSLEQINMQISQTSREAEAVKIQALYPEARQIMFMPVWNPTSQVWYSGCFIWTKTMNSIFTYATEMTFLGSFMSLLASEISRHDLIEAEQTKLKFIRSISHEFRSPLHAIIASTEMLQETDPSTNQAELMSYVASSATLLLGTVENVLDHSSINVSQVPRLHTAVHNQSQYSWTQSNVALKCEDALHTVLFTSRRTAFDSWQHEADTAVQNVGKDPTGTSVDFYIAPGDWQCDTPPGTIQRILIHLLGNAIKFTDSGSISVSMVLKNESGDTVPSERSLLLSVQDTGRGMSSGFLNRRLYKPFAQESLLSEGAGLGLSIVRKLVEQLNGDIRFESQVKKGTAVLVTIPVGSQMFESDQQYRSSQVQLTQEDRNAENIVCSVRALAPKHKVSIFKSSSSSGVNMQLMAQILQEWFGFEVSMSMSSHDTGGIVIADGSDLDKTWQDAIACKDAYVFLVSGETSLRPSTPSSLKAGFAGRIEWPIGPHRLAQRIWQGMQNLDRTQEQHRTRKDSITYRPPSIETGLKPTLRVLAVDDNGVNLQLLKKFLSKFPDTKTTLAKDGLLALQAVQALSPDQFHLILMDISMPVMDGFESTRQIRKWEQEQSKDSPSRRAVRIVAVTGLASEHDRAEAKSAGIDDYMTKPARLADIRSVVEQMRASI